MEKNDINTKILIMLEESVGKIKKTKLKEAYKFSSTPDSIVESMTSIGNTLALAFKNVNEGEWNINVKLSSNEGVRKKVDIIIEKKKN